MRLPWTKNDNLLTFVFTMVLSVLPAKYAAADKVYEFMKKIFTALSIIFLLSVASCAVQDDFPETYDNINWVEISRDEAIEIWKTYDTTTVRHNDLTVWEKQLGKNAQKWSGAEIDASSYENASGIIGLADDIGNLTTNPSKEDETAHFFKKENDTSLIKIERIPEYADSNYTLDIYKDGWCVVKKIYRGFDGYNFYFIDYD